MTPPTVKAGRSQRQPSSSPSLNGARRRSPSNAPDLPVQDQHLSLSQPRIEALYNASVQSFVRRDQTKAQASLSEILFILHEHRSRKSSLLAQPAWCELDSRSVSGGDEESVIEEWTLKCLKLYISCLASLYNEPPSNVSTLPVNVTSLLPPSAQPSQLLEHLKATCLKYSPSSDPSSLPPQLLSTLILASLKLSPADSALEYIHKSCEGWLASLPDSLIASISGRLAADSIEGDQKKNARQKKRVESAREGYLKVVELFVGEVLSRENEFEMARGFLDGEIVMGIKRKEALYRHLRAVESAYASKSAPLILPETQSPSASLVLPSESSSSTLTTRPSRSRSGKMRSDSRSSASSSSSEKTARPSAGQIGMSQKNAMHTVDRKGKAKEIMATSSVNERQLAGNALPKKINSVSPSIDSKSSGQPPMTSENGIPTRSPLSVPVTLIQSVLRLMPANISHTLQRILHGTTFNSVYNALAIPLPVILLAVIIIQRTRRRPSASKPNLTAIGAAAGAAGLGSRDIRSRLVLARMRGNQQGWRDWLVYYVRWWINKFSGVWKLGTTITYV